ncbi:macrophage erythroblast attacher [Ctenocephalides felis]|uniref:macrophage erythroblast attacher n=1 Tax=Ctenocephalides felis TaxID=7515 RepID=UPI000E6E45BD|nr:macrophage erythroblast attacher [Ctenocephalides felis]
MADVRALEHPTLKVPYEVLNKKFRIAQKTLDREMSHVQSAAAELEKNLSIKNAGEISKLIGGVVEKLQVLKRKAEESISEEIQAGYVCKRRLEHLKQHVAPNPVFSPEVSQAAMNHWRHIRLDRMLIEHFLHHGYYESAEKLATTTNLRDLTNVDIFRMSREVEQDLAKHRTAKCAAWCADNKSKLRKLNSTMEFKLRVQEFVELIKADRRLDAVKFARKQFPAYEKDQLCEIGHCMALLAFPVTTTLEPYRSLFDPSRWTDLVIQFRHENYRLYQLGSQSVLAVALQVGLSALKTPQCYSITARNYRCPVCQGPLNQLAMGLPYAHCAQSRLVCRITGQPLNEHNLPMMLPNGQVYGEKAIKDIADQSNGVIMCPTTQQVYGIKHIEKVFVM